MLNWLRWRPQAARETVRRYRSAERDLDQIKSYLVENAGPRIARRVFGKIREQLSFLGVHPGAWHVRDDLTDRPLRFWAVYSYLIVYDSATLPIQIIRILQGKRDVESTLN